MANANETREDGEGYGAQLGVDPHPFAGAKGLPRPSLACVAGGRRAARRGGGSPHMNARRAPAGAWRSVAGRAEGGDGGGWVEHVKWRGRLMCERRDAPSCLPPAPPTATPCLSSL